MKNHLWKNAWAEKKFEIQTLIPSILVSRYQSDISQGDYVLDVGSGNGRNSIYLANRGIEVDLFDVINVIDWDSLTNTIKNNLHFKEATILNYTYPTNKYKAAIATRVIQYLKPKEVSFLLKKLVSSLKPDGFLLLSYNTEGGIFSREEINVPKYVHKIEDIKKLLEKHFGQVEITEGSSRSMYVNYSDNITTFDIYCCNNI